MREASPFAGIYLSCMDGECKAFDRFNGVFNFLPDLWRRSPVRAAKPVVTDHAVFVGIGDGPRLESFHGTVGRLYLRLHTGKIVDGKIHPADVECQADGGTDTKILFIPFPGGFVRHDIVLKWTGGQGAKDSSFLFAGNQ